MDLAHARFMLFGRNAKVTFEANARLMPFVDARVKFALRDAKVRLIVRDARLMFAL